MNIAGKCHCGNIAFTLEWGAEAPIIPARACGCTFCAKRLARRKRYWIADVRIQGNGGPR